MTTGRATGILTAGVAAGLFTSRLLGELVPDSLAASVCMFGAGALSGGLLGLVVGLSWARPRC
jgi:hypothetical protein